MTGVKKADLIDRILELGEEEGRAYVTNAEEAQLYLTQMQEAMENALAGE